MEIVVPAAQDATLTPAFYLPTAALEDLSDCFAVVQGIRLPLHSQILSAQSVVLQELFLGQREGSGAPPDLSATFDGSSAEAVACFLSLLYSPQGGCPAGFAVLLAAGHLEGVARLAHKLNASTLLQGLESYLLGLSGSLPAQQDSTAQLLCALRVAETCQLSALQGRFLAALADALAATGPSWPKQHSQSLAALDAALLVTLVRVTGERAVQGLLWATRVFDVRPVSSADVAGCFTCALEGFSKLNFKPDNPVSMPCVEVGGFKWNLEVYPVGYGHGKGTHLSAFLSLDAVHARAAGTRSVRARFRVTALDQRLGPGAPSHNHSRGDMSRTPDVFHTHATNWGWSTFLPLDQLHSADRGLLAHDRLLLRVEIWVTGMRKA